eukprot:12938238-Prorocentrum_lima.AAC.1
MHQCYITSHDEETNCEVELYLPQHMAHWFNECPRELHAYECLVFTVNKQSHQQSSKESLTT